MVKKILKWFLYLLPAAMIIFYLVTSFSMNLPSEMKKFLWNDTALKLYEKEGRDMNVRSDTTYNGYMTEDGYFGIFNVLYTPEIGQFQVTVRYNFSTVRKINEKRAEKGMPEIPGDEKFCVALYSEKNNEFYTKYEYIKKEKSRHAFRRYIFDGVTADKDDKIWIYVYANDTVDFGSEPQGKLLVFEGEYGDRDYNISKSKPEKTEGLIKAETKDNYDAPVESAEETTAEETQK